MAMWDIEFFEKDNSRCPTQEFLDGLSTTKDLPYINNAIKQLEEHGNQLRRPLADNLGQKLKLWELRVRTINGQFRFLYFFFGKNKIIITHGIKKNKGKIPPEEIKKAQEYRLIYISRKESQK